MPIERHYQAYSARVSAAPPVTALLLHDLTAIRRSEQMRADFVANASHELRTPLAAVSGFIDTLRGHAKDDEAAREKFLDIMSVEAGAHAPADRRSAVAHPHRAERACAAARAQSTLDEVVREAAAALAAAGATPTTSTIDDRGARRTCRRWSASATS